ncbi:transposase [Brevundimonas sp. NPDC090276]|uniref:transposase n=1 Tax=Brevundimonas sp. NPDC090276 TaxID=3363956 RepID=UPI00383A0883
MGRSAFISDRSEPNSLPDGPWTADDDAAFAYLERVVWQDGFRCRVCGRAGLSEPDSRKHWRYCGHCRKRFSLRAGTMFAGDTMPLGKAISAIWFMNFGEGPVYIARLERVMGTSPGATQRLFDRVSRAMSDQGLEPLGSGGDMISTSAEFERRLRLIALY